MRSFGIGGNFWVTAAIVRTTNRARFSCASSIVTIAGDAWAWIETACFAASSALVLPTASSRRGPSGTAVGLTCAGTFRTTAVLTHAMSARFSRLMAAYVLPALVAATFLTVASLTTFAQSDATSDGRVVSVDCRTSARAIYSAACGVCGYVLGTGYLTVQPPPFASDHCTIDDAALRNSVYTCVVHEPSMYIFPCN